MKIWPPMDFVFRVCPRGACYVAGIVGLGLLLQSLAAYAHGEHQNQPHQMSPRALQQVDWRPTQIANTLTAGYPVSFGLYAFTKRQNVSLVERNGYVCIEANFLAFDIDDHYAFNLNQDITAELLIDATHSDKLFIGYDKHGDASANVEVSFDDTPGLQWLSVTLPSARFINRGIGGTDLALAHPNSMLPDGSFGDEKTTFIVCDVKLDDEIKPAPVTQTVPITFEFVDESGAVTPVRYAIYDQGGSIVLPLVGTEPITFFETPRIHQSLSAFYPPFQKWPHQNRYFYYTGGTLNGALPPGQYQLIASKGPEYRLYQSTINVRAGLEPGNKHRIELERWIDMPKLGWLSGDVHIHIPREKSENQAISSILQAEDIHMSNLLVMSSSAKNYYPQYGFGKSGVFSERNYHITPGVEGPRTALRGHTIALDIETLLPTTDELFLYHKSLQAYRQQQAVLGYAHVGSGEFNASWGLALDVPYGLVDFVEVMQASRLRTEIWYHFLNLGFKLAPAAGSDFPYFDQPGAVRSYVEVDPNEPQEWFAGLQQGRTFVTNGPILSLGSEQATIGDTLSFSENPRALLATVATNPDLDSIKSLEIVYCGEVVASKTYPPKASRYDGISWTLPPYSSGWVAVRAKGYDDAIAHTGAIYIASQTKGHQCLGKLKDSVAFVLDKLSQMQDAKMDVNKELEYWDSDNLPGLFQAKKQTLLKRIVETRRFYEQLLSQ